MQKLIFLLITIFISFFTYSSAQKAQSIDFKWEKDSINGKLADKIAMSVPFTIEDKTYRFQFDLGANMTLFYDQCFEKTELIKNKKFGIII